MNLNTDIEIKSYIGRELVSKPLSQVKIVSVLFVLNIVFVGYLGVIRGFFSYTDKTLLYEEYMQVQNNLSKNLSILNDIAPYVRETAGTNFVNKAIPDEIAAAEYLTELTTVASQNGYILQNMSISGGTAETITLSLRFSGYRSRLEDFLQDLEYLDRLTNIKSLNYSITNTDGTEIMIRMTALIYRSY